MNGRKNRSGISLFCWSEYVISYYQLVDCNQRVLPIVFFLFFFSVSCTRGEVASVFSTYKLDSLAGMAGIAGTTILDYRLQCKMDKRPKWDRFRFVLRKNNIRYLKLGNNRRKNIWAYRMVKPTSRSLNFKYASFNIRSIPKIWLRVWNFAKSWILKWKFPILFEIFFFIQGLLLWNCFWFHIFFLYLSLAQ